MTAALSRPALDQLFETARSQNAWLDEGVDEALMREIYRLASLGPTSANSSPGRFVFVTTEAGKRRLAEHAAEMNKAKVLSAPVTVIIAMDTRFYEEMGKLFPQRPQMGDMFRNAPPLAAENAMRNSSLQGAYLMMAARALGLDAGPMSGFSNATLDADFFPDGRFKSNFICSLGRGDPAGVFPKLPRLSFEDACTVV